MDEKQFNLKCAKYLGLWGIKVLNDQVHYTGFDNIGEVGYIFNPYSDANDRNKVIEKMRIITDFDLSDSKWSCYIIFDTGEKATGLGTKNFVDNESMEAAQNACIWAYLESISE